MQALPQKSFERNMNHNYLIIHKYEFFDQEEDSQDYRTRMLLDNTIKGLLPVSHRIINGENKYYYEINSLQSMDRVYDKNEIDYKQLRSLLLGCIRLYSELEEYLLDGSQVILHPEYVYLNVESLEPCFVYYPYYEEDARESFARFMEELLKKIDHTDEKAVMLAYQVYRYTRNQNYVLSEVAGLIANVESLDEQEKKEPVNTKEHNGFCEEENNGIYNSLNYECTWEDEKIEEPQIMPQERSGKPNKDLMGVVICVFAGLLEGGILAGSCYMDMYVLNVKQQMALYGAIGMSIVAAVIFLACYFRKRNKEQEEAEIQQEDDQMDEFWKENEQQNHYYKQKDYRQDYYENKVFEGCGDTICLQQLPSQERYLMGQVNGEDIRISLNKLPLTIGKMSGWADCVIPDSTVSKLHARIEEKEGIIYLEDLNSTNGTVRNGNMLNINEPVALQSGDELKLGRVCLRFYA